MVGRTTDELFGLFRNSDEQAEIVEMLRACTPGTERAHSWSWKSDVDFSLLSSLVGALGVQEPTTVLQFLDDSPGIQIHEDDRAFVHQLIQLAIVYQKEVLQARTIQVQRADLSEEQVSALQALSETLSGMEFGKPRSCRVQPTGRGKRMNWTSSPGSNYSMRLTDRECLWSPVGHLISDARKKKAIEKIEGVLDDKAPIRALHPSSIVFLRGSSNLINPAACAAKMTRARSLRSDFERPATPAAPNVPGRLRRASILFLPVTQVTQTVSRGNGNEPIGPSALPATPPAPCHSDTQPPLVTSSAASNSTGTRLLEESLFSGSNAMVPSSQEKADRNACSKANCR